MSGFSEARSFLFIYETSLPKQDIELILEFAAEIKAEKKDVFFLIYHEFKKVPESVFVKSFDIHICKKDFNFLKQPTSSMVKRQCNMQYDYLFSFIEKRNTRLENFIRKSKALIKIGRKELHRKPLYRITFGSSERENSIEDFLKMAGNYITKIKIEK
ncbi:MAG: hypothetical protein J5I91_00565 [Bacteroidetes bacterium]|nr:hypothetical protein [Bacteroidota bacterium]